ncbi:type II toxin-antitoxin system RelB/DinJ family antitoxin [Levilactobacillus fuyuanensis]|uniref:Type II toxin-antitoxin system RelB/DinJ family antitoxin n=2 Tax=Levilactobacillus fuyuanensis TaxID=2486022 RepID=A0ABW4H2W6_9LACO|nr:type II toxin-antitoxin system RelB/DinJ family antitoxin [Levilactobacillus fuyuanensis]
MPGKMHEMKCVQANLDKVLVKQAEQVFKDIGMTPTSALTSFYEQVVANKRMPFELPRISPEEKLSQVVQQEIADGKFKKVSSRKELSHWLADDEKEN